MYVHTLVLGEGLRGCVCLCIQECQMTSDFESLVSDVDKLFCFFVWSSVLFLSCGVVF